MDMPRPTNKTELLDLSASNYEKILKMIDGVTVDVISEAGACAQWSIKDILAHLHGWHLMYLRWYEEGMAGEKPEMPAPGYTWASTPELNAEIHARYKDDALEDILALLNETHHKVMKIIENHSDEELFTKKKYAWTGTTSLGSYTVSAMSSHYDWAIKHVKKFLKFKD
jgi:hypothetical protein